LPSDVQLFLAVAPILKSVSALRVLLCCVRLSRRNTVSLAAAAVPSLPSTTFYLIMLDQTKARIHDSHSARATMSDRTETECNHRNGSGQTGEHSSTLVQRHSNTETADVLQHQASHRRIISTRRYTIILVRPAIESPSPRYPIKSTSAALCLLIPFLYGSHSTCISCPGLLGRTVTGSRVRRTPISLDSVPRKSPFCPYIGVWYVQEAQRRPRSLPFCSGEILISGRRARDAQHVFAARCGVGDSLCRWRVAHACPRSRWTLGVSPLHGSCRACVWVGY